MKGIFCKLSIFLIWLLTSQTNFAQYGISQALEMDKEEGGVCLPCLNALNLLPNQVIWNVKTENNQVYFEISHSNYIDTIFGKATDGIAVSVVERKQYTCSMLANLVTPAIKRGKLIEPVYYSEFRSSIEIDETKGSAKFLIGELPSNIEQYELNVLLIKNKKVCWAMGQKGIANSQWELLQMGLMTDTVIQEVITNIKVDTLVKDHFKKMKFIIPFEKNKWEYKPQDVKPMYDSLHLTDFQIMSITIHAYASVEGTTERNLTLQEKRAESIVAALASYQTEKIKNTVSSSENWSEFYEDLLSEKHTDLAQLSKPELKQKLNHEGWSKKLEPILQRHRKAVIQMELQKRTQHEKETKEVVVKEYHKSILNKETEKALGLQEEIYNRIKAGEMNIAELQELDLPTDTHFTTLMANNLVFNYQRGAQVEDVLAAFEELDKKAPRLSIKYNIAALKVIKWANGNILNKPRKLKKEILYLKKAGFNPRLVSRLMTNFHITRSQHSMQVHDYAAKNRSVNFVKGNYWKCYSGDEDLIRVGKYFTHYNRADWATDVLYRKSKHIDVDDDVIYYLLNVTILNPKDLTEKRYRTVLNNAIDKDKERFCGMFDGENPEVTFQLLSNKFFRKVWCRECQ